MLVMYDVIIMSTLSDPTRYSDGGSSVGHSPEELVNVSCLVKTCQSTTVVYSLGRRGRGGGDRKIGERKN